MDEMATKETSRELISSAWLNNRTTKVPNSSSSSAVRENGKEDMGAEESEEDNGINLLIPSNSCSRLLSKPNLSSPLLDPLTSKVSTSPLAPLTLDILPLWPQFLLLQTLCVRMGSPPNPNSGCPEIQPNTTNSGGPNNRYTKV